MSEVLRSLNIMTLKELQTITNAYDNFVTVENSNIDEYYKNLFGYHCECGAEMVIDKDNNTRLQCCNPECWVKWAYKLDSFISYFGFKDIGEETCKKLIRETRHKFAIPTFLSVFLVDMNLIYSVLGDAQFEKFINIKNTLANSSFWLRDAVASLSLIGIGKSSKLFNFVDDVNVLASAMLQNKTDELCNICGINDTMVRFGLYAGRLDVFVFIKKIAGAIRTVPKGTFNIAITGSVSIDGVPLTRKEFISKCESLCDITGRPLFGLNETSSSKLLQFVIADVPSSSSKYSLGRKLGILVTADEFYKILCDERDNINKSIEESRVEQ